MTTRLDPRHPKHTMNRVDIVDFTTSENEIFAIRFRVFVEEQGVDPELEIDGLDSDCAHALALVGDKPVGTGRLLPDGRIGRMAVLKEYRSQGIGSLILETLIDEARKRGSGAATLSSQLHAVPFYERHGFTTHGETYLEAGIDHIDMHREL